MPTPRSVSMAFGLTRLELTPAIPTSNLTPSCLKSPLAVWLRAELPVQRTSTFFFSVILFPLRLPAANDLAGQCCKNRLSGRAFFVLNQFSQRRRKPVELAELMAFMLGLLRRGASGSGKQHT